MEEGGGRGARSLGAGAAGGLGLRGAWGCGAAVAALEAVPPLGSGIWGCGERRLCDFPLRGLPHCIFPRVPFVHVHRLRGLESY